MRRLDPECPPSDPFDRSLPADTVLRQEPDDEDDEEQDDKKDENEDEEDDETNDGYSE